VKTVVSMPSRKPHAADLQTHREHHRHKTQTQTHTYNYNHTGQKPIHRSLHQRLLNADLLYAGRMRMGVLAGKN
jgi:hypothetical protein